MLSAITIMQVLLLNRGTAPSWHALAATRSRCSTPRQAKSSAPCPAMRSPLRPSASLVSGPFRISAIPASGKRTSIEGTLPRFVPLHTPLPSAPPSSFLSSPPHLPSSLSPPIFLQRTPPPSSWPPAPSATATSPSLTAASSARGRATAPPSWTWPSTRLAPSSRRGPPTGRSGCGTWRGASARMPSRGTRTLSSRSPSTPDPTGLGSCRAPTTAR